MRDEQEQEQGEVGVQGGKGENAGVDSAFCAQSVALPLWADVWQQTLGWQPTAQQQQQFQQLYDLVLAGNRQFNLTRITEANEFWEKHLWDSLRGIRAVWAGDGQGETADTPQAPRSQPLNSLSLKVIDIGTGAGFPGIPVAIAQPAWTVTLLDATRKKIHFLEQLLASLQITNALPRVARVEALGKQNGDRQTYDLALIRAVASASVCAEYALPLLKIGGSAVLYRGQWTDAETASLAAAVATLGGTIEAIDTFTTPLTQSDRHCLYLKKIAPTPSDFPRAIGIPTQNPL